MPIPNSQHAFIDPAKLRDYLLAPSHPVGRYKAVVFHSVGYTQQDWQQLAADLRTQHLTLEPQHPEDHPYGTIYEIIGDLTGPSGKILYVRSVWIILKSEDRPRFVTAYPGKTP